MNETKKRSALALLLALSLLLGLTLPASAGDSGYSDVPDGHWAGDSVEQATELGLFYGVEDGAFGLGQPITRAAFVTALTRLLRWEEAVPTGSAYSDVPRDAWYCAAVETAAEHGALSAADRTFRPGDNITREEMASMLVRGLGYTSLAGIASSYGSPFTDVTTNRGFITLAYDMGIIGGVGDGRFDPNGTATREQAAAVLVRVHERLYAQSIRLALSSSYELVGTAAPQPNPEDELPTTPLEPLAELYAALRQLRESGTDLSRAALRLTSGGIRTVVEAGKPLASEPLSAREVEAILALDGVKTYYSDRYECAYCIYQPGPNQEATVWFQEEAGTAAKLQLARLFGVTRYVMA